MGDAVAPDCARPSATAAMSTPGRSCIPVCVAGLNTVAEAWATARWSRCLPPESTKMSIGDISRLPP